MAAKNVINSSHPLHPIGHALAAAEELLEAIYRLRPDDAHGKTYGTQEIAVSAWFARG